MSHQLRRKPIQWNRSRRSGRWSARAKAFKVVSDHAFALQSLDKAGLDGRPLLPTGGAVDAAHMLQESIRAHFLPERRQVYEILRWVGMLGLHWRVAEIASAFQKGAPVPRNRDLKQRLFPEILRLAADSLFKAGLITSKMKFEIESGASNPELLLKKRQ